MSEQKSQQRELPQPLRAAASVLRKVPGAGMVARAGEDVLDKVGAVSPRGRRIAVYTGAGVLGVAGVVEWPVAVTGAAVAWLTQQHREKSPRPQGIEESEAEQIQQTEEGAEAIGGTAVRTGGAEPADTSGAAEAKASGQVPTPKVMASSGNSSTHGRAVPDTPSGKLPPHGEASSAASPQRADPAARRPPVVPVRAAEGER
ncbi:hypothetical protein OHS71_40825 [Streptomyces sp. NBC_00377]|uniref:hypothetical protein n=1 Tax=unclassified Streptomyces TaxID=2593676 RepID=UPI002E1ADB1F|nr:MULTISPECIES: hypothetical protein [unclassified Streptomyces]